MLRTVRIGNMTGTMNIGIPLETDPHETRSALSPVSAAKLVKLGASVQFEAGLGNHCQWPDQAYLDAGATLATRSDIVSASDLLLRVRKPSVDEIASQKKGSWSISFMDPFNDQAVVTAFAQAGVNSISMEMIPRSTRAQKMDALSSQHSIAGYYMVIHAAERCHKVLPMMTTPAGTLQPVRVFVIGVGVAGLQAIATAKRLGARVDAFDTRAECEEQVHSLGAKFLKIDLGETGSTNQGYAKQLSAEQLAKQQAGMAKQCAVSDIVITTAQLFGRKAPVVVTKAMLAQMAPGAMVVDYAVESGGNVEGSVPGETVTIHGVNIVGLRNYPGHIAQSASQMYAANVANYVEEFWDKERKVFDPKADDVIAQGSIITRDGAVVNETIKKLLEASLAASVASATSTSAQNA